MLRAKVASASWTASVAKKGKEELMLKQNLFLKGTEAFLRSLKNIRPTSNFRVYRHNYKNKIQIEMKQKINLTISDRKLLLHMPT
jgi:hypothetical protein